MCTLQHRYETTKDCWLLSCHKPRYGMKIRCVPTSWIHLGPAHEASERSWTKALVLLSAYSRLCWGYPRKTAPTPLLALCSSLSAVRLASGRSSRHSRRRPCPLGLRQEGEVVMMSSIKTRCGKLCYRQSSKEVIKMEINIFELVISQRQTVPFAV